MSPEVISLEEHIPQDSAIAGYVTHGNWLCCASESPVWLHQGCILIRSPLFEWPSRSLKGHKCSILPWEVTNSIT